MASVTNEPLGPGPSGRLVQVVDYDATRDVYYSPVDLDDPSVMLQGGLAPDEADPRFHQQMVYAVAMGVLERFEQALGRPFKWRGDDRLRIYPHAFERRNACFDPSLDPEGGIGGLLFGYFTADKANPGPNIPGQLVFTCLSHTVIAHETTHAVLHRLRPGFESPTNPDVFGFHEGLADIVAMLLPFTYQDIVRQEIASSRGRLSDGTYLLELAQQFGFAQGDDKALRTALTTPDPGALDKTKAPHRRGQILASAVISSFLRSYESESRAAIRLATSGSGVLAPGALHPDLVASLAGTASRIAERTLDMCIRAIDYLPPVDVTFSDYLRAIVTADADLHPDDSQGSRANIIESFRERGIYPKGSVSLAEGAVRIPKVEPDLCERIDVNSVFLLDAVQEFEVRSPANPRQLSPATGNTEFEGPADTDIMREVAISLQVWASKKHPREVFGFADDVPIQAKGFHFSQRRDSAGYVRTILTIQFLQTEKKPTAAELKRARAEGRRMPIGGLRRRGGATVVADSTGQVLYIVAKPYPAVGSSAAAAIEMHLGEFEFHNPQLAWTDEPQPIEKNFTLRGLDDQRF